MDSIEQGVHCFISQSFLLLTLSKFLSSEFLTENSFMKKGYKITVSQNSALFTRRSGMYFGKSFKVARTDLKSDLSKT